MRNSIRGSVLPLLLVAGLAGAGGWWFGQRGQPTNDRAGTPPAARKILYYQSPMHPWIRADQPGNCTICGMALAPVYEGDVGRASGPGIVALPASTVTTIGVATEPAAQRTLRRSLRVAGSIDDDETKHRFLSARVPGRIEQLFVHYVGAEVRAGAPLATIYSPELLTAQREFLQRLRAGPTAYPAGELAAARERLLSLGLEPDEITQVERSGEPVAHATVRAPFTGTIVEREAYVGHYVKPEDHLFTLGDFSRMWFLFQAYEQDLAWLRVGQTVEFTTRAVPGRVFRAPIDFIDPNLDATTRSTAVRVVVDNPRSTDSPDAARVLPHRVFAEGTVQLEGESVLAVPRTAVLDAGTGPLAYVEREAGVYEQRRLRLGRRGDAHVEVLEGVREGDKVVTHGALLVDAQAQLAYGAAAHAPPATDAAHDPAAAYPFPADAREPLATLIRALSSSGRSLAADDLPGYQREFAALQSADSTLQRALPASALGGKGQSLRAAAGKLMPPTTLEAARDAFEPYSTVVADIARAARAAGATPADLHIFECPMSPRLGRGRWVQTDAELRNPFFGAAMLRCGEEIK